MKTIFPIQWKVIFLFPSHWLHKSIKNSIIPINCILSIKQNAYAKKLRNNPFIIVHHKNHVCNVELKILVFKKSYFLGSNI